MVHVFQKIINKSIQIIPFIILFYLWFFLLGNFLSPSGSPNMLSHLNQNLLSLFIFVFTQIFLYIFFKIYKYKYIVIGYVLICFNISCLYVNFLAQIYIHIFYFYFISIILYINIF